MKIRPVGAEMFHADGRTERHDEANSLLGYFVNAPRKLNFTLGEAMKVQRGAGVGGGGDIAILLLQPRRFTPEKDTLYQLLRGLGGPQGRSGRAWEISPHPPAGFDP